MANPFRQKAVRGIRPGDSFVFSRQFSKQETWAFGDLTRDYNPVHYDETWTDAKGFRGLICHGLLVGGMICEFGGQVGWLATGMEFKFIRPVYFEDRIECRVTITGVDETGKASAEAVFINQDGIKVCLARLTGRLPVEKERQLLSRMVEQGDPTNKLAHCR